MWIRANHFGTPYLLLGPLNLLRGPLIHLIFIRFAWFLVGQFANMYGTFLETAESEQYNLALRFPKRYHLLWQGDMLKIRGFKELLKGVNVSQNDLECSWWFLRAKLYSSASVVSKRYHTFWQTNLLNIRWIRGKSGELRSPLRKLRGPEGGKGFQSDFSVRHWTPLTQRFPKKYYTKNLKI